MTLALKYWLKICGLGSETLKIVAVQGINVFSTKGMHTSLKHQQGG